MSHKGETILTTQLMLWWLPLLVGVIIVLGSMIVLIPQTTAIFDNKQKLDNAEETLQKARTKLDQLTSLDQTELDEQQRLIHLALPPYKPYYEVFATIQRISVETGAVIDKFDLKPGSLSTPSAEAKKTRKEGFDTLKTKFTISGRGEIITSFIEKIQQSVPLFGLTAATIGQDSENAGRSAQIEIEIYYSVLSQSGKKDFSYEPLKMLSIDEKATLNVLAGYAIPTNTSLESFTQFNREDPFKF